MNETDEDLRGRLMVTFVKQGGPVGSVVIPAQRDIVSLAMFASREAEAFMLRRVEPGTFWFELVPVGEAPVSVEACVAVDDAFRMYLPMTYAWEVHSLEPARSPYPDDLVESAKALLYAPPPRYAPMRPRGLSTK